VTQIRKKAGASATNTASGTLDYWQRTRTPNLDHLVVR
jgi:hypothetical protein